MEYKEFQNYDDEVTIDLAHFMISVMKKWKVLVALVIIGASLGGAWHFISAESAQSASAKPAKLTEEMEVASLYRSQYEMLQTYAKNSPFMKLNSEDVVIGELSYLLPGEDMSQEVSAYFSSVLKDAAVREALCGILGIEEETDLDKMVFFGSEKDRETSLSSLTLSDTSSTLKAERREPTEHDRRNLCFTVYAENKERAQEALYVLDKAADSSKKEHALPCSQVAQSVRRGNSAAIRAMQNQLVEDMKNAFKIFSALEGKFSDSDEALYQMYITTGDISNFSAAAASSNPLKKPILLAVVFAFLGCAWYAVAYLLSGKVKTVDEVNTITRRNILGYIDETAPKKNVIDRWLDSLEGHSFPAPVSAAYAAAAAAKLGQTVVVYDEQDNDLRKTAQEMAVPSMGLVGQNSQTLSSLSADTNVVLLVKLGATTKMQLQRETAMCSQYGIPLAGSILVK